MAMVAMRIVLISVAMASVALGKSVKNPADALANEINKNLTNSKLPKLYNNPGLACIALQYIQAYQGQCDDVGPKGQRPSDSLFRSTFSDNCGVDPSSVSDVTGIVLACQSKYKDASYTFPNLLFKETSTVSTLQNSNQTEFGVGISGYQGGSPYFWCVLFSSGQPNSSFMFMDKKAKYQKTGCFSGTGEACSGASSTFTPVSLLILLVTWLAFYN